MSQQICPSNVPSLDDLTILLPRDGDVSLHASVIRPNDYILEIKYLLIFMLIPCHRRTDREVSRSANFLRVINVVKRG